MRHVHFSTPVARYTWALWLGSIGLLVVILLAMAIPRYNHVFKSGDVLGGEAGSIRLEELDFVSEPGEISDSTRLDRFFERQTQIALLLNTSPRLLEPGEAILKEKSVSLASLPITFWTQVVVGLGAFLISAWIWALKPGCKASFLFFLSGISTLTFTSSSALYTTRYLALPADFFRTLTAVNEMGASAFGI